MTLRAHKSVDFVVDDAAGDERFFRTLDEAAGFALSLALSYGKPANIDVLIHSVEGARFWGGAAAVEEYREDPEASVFERIVITARSEGRVP